jgi:hypothetical protein
MAFSGAGRNGREPVFPWEIPAGKCFIWHGYTENPSGDCGILLFPCIAGFPVHSRQSSAGKDTLLLYQCFTAESGIHGTIL